jgi:Cytochrome c554 and c-prime
LRSTRRQFRLAGREAHPTRRAGVQAIVLLLLATTAFADSQCASCHVDQAKSQPATDMAWALMPVGENRILRDNPKLTLQRGIYTYTVLTHDNQSTYTVTDGANTLSLPIRWAFGGVRSQTWVFDYNGHFYESLVSYFEEIRGLDTTIGDNSLHPQTLVEAMGRELSDFEVKSCFDCHATNAVVDDRLNLAGLTAGVQCTRCHVGAQRHAEAISQGKLDFLPEDLAKRTPEDISNFCGQCHRTWERVVRDHLFGTINVRFQPYRLENSKCFDGGDPRMSCLACHDPHHNVVRGEYAYDSKCLACHSAANAASAKAETCPVGTKGCPTCHMPKVELPGGHMLFTDHLIRIVHPGEPYPR